MLFIPYIIASRLLVQNIESVIRNRINNLTENDIYYNILLLSVKFKDENTILININKTTALDDILDFGNEALHELIVDNSPNWFIDNIVHLINSHVHERSLILISINIDVNHADNEYKYFEAQKTKLRTIDWNHRVLYVDYFKKDYFTNKTAALWCLTQINNQKDISYVYETEYNDNPAFILVEFKKEFVLVHLRNNDELNSFEILNLDDTIKRYLYDMIYDIFINYVYVYKHDINDVGISIKLSSIAYDEGIIKFVNEECGLANDYEFRETLYLTPEHIKYYLKEYQRLILDEGEDIKLMTRFKQMQNYIFNGKFNVRELHNNLTNIQKLCTYYAIANILDPNMSLKDYINCSIFLTTVPADIVKEFYRIILADSTSMVFRTFVREIYETNKVQSDVHHSLAYLNYLGTLNGMQAKVFDQIQLSMREMIRRLSFRNLIFDYEGDINLPTVLFIYKILNGIVIENISRERRNKWIVIVKAIGDYYRIEKDDEYLLNVVKKYFSLLGTSTIGIFGQLNSIIKILAYYSMINSGEDNTEELMRDHFGNMMGLLNDAQFTILEYDKIIIQEVN